MDNIVDALDKIFMSRMRFIIFAAVLNATLVLVPGSAVFVNYI